MTEIQYVPLLGFNPSWIDGIEVGDLFQQFESISQRVIEVISNWKVDGKSCSILEFASRGGVSHILLKILAQIHEKDPDFDNVSKSDVAECFYDIYPYSVEYKDSLFYARFADVVSAYYLKRVLNDINEFRAKKYPESSISFLEESAFLEKYGPQPIELVKRVLKRAHLPYEIIGPNEDDPFSKYTIRDVDRIRGIEISLDALSSGEKVLMSLGMAIYNTKVGGSKTCLLLLDEPDATLHPEYSKLMIDILHDVIYQQAGIKVILTTHSPSRVAMCPEGMVFELKKGDTVPKQVKNADAIRALLDGVDYLQVNYQPKKVIFVESANDVQYCNSFYRALARPITLSASSFVYEPVFWEPHSGSGSNCDKVVSTVGRLRDFEESFFGIIDYDNNNSSRDGVFVLGGGNRHSIENYLLDPLYIAIALIREGKSCFSDFGVDRFQGYPAAEAASGLEEVECQVMIDSVLKKLDFEMEDLRICSLRNGFKVKYPSSFLLLRGHDYEELLFQKFPGLGALTRGRTEDFKLKSPMLKVIDEYRQFLSVDIEETLCQILQRG